MSGTVRFTGRVRVWSSARTRERESRLRGITASLPAAFNFSRRRRAQCAQVARAMAAFSILAKHGSSRCQSASGNTRVRALSRRRRLARISGDRPMARIIETATGAMALTFDDVLLQPAHSEVMPAETDVAHPHRRRYRPQHPDPVGSDGHGDRSAAGHRHGPGRRHRRHPPQSRRRPSRPKQVRQVKKFESGMVVNPVTIGPDATLADALGADAARTAFPAFRWSRTAASAASKTGRLVGILTNRDVRFASDPAQKVAELMTRDKPGHRQRDGRPGRGQAAAAPAPHREAAGRRRRRQLRRADHGQGHREVAAQPERRQGRAGPAARRRRDQRRRRRFRARRAADRCRRRPAGHRYRARPFAARARSGNPRQEAVQLGAGRWPATSPPPTARRR